MIGKIQMMNSRNLSASLFYFLQQRALRMPLQRVKTEDPSRDPNIENIQNSGAPFVCVQVQEHSVIEKAFRYFTYPSIYLAKYHLSTLLCTFKSLSMQVELTL